MRNAKKKVKKFIIKYKHHHVAALVVALVAISAFMGSQTQPQVALATAPGGVFSNMNVWLRADSSSVTQTGDGTDVTDWTDLSTNAYLFDRATSGIGGTAPKWYTSRINGNPVVDFSSGTSTERLGIASFNGWPTGNFWITTVYSRRNSNSNEAFWTYGTYKSTMVLRPSNFESYYGGTWNAYTDAVDGDDGNAHINTMRRTGSTLSVVLDGLQIQSLSNSATSTQGYCLVLGEFMSSNCTTFINSYDFEGDIAEMIVYSAYPSAADQQKVNSYLAIKYAIPLDQSTAADYLDSAGNVIWNSNDTTYNHGIVGIGQDDGSGLNQTSTKYPHKENILQISEAADQDDGEFLIWGHNNGDRLWTSTGAPSGYQILDRVYKVQETGDVGTVDIEFDVRDPEWMVPILLSGSSFYLVYDSDEDDDLSDETPVAMVDTGASGDDTSSDDKWTYQLDFPDGVVGAGDDNIEFTIATLDGTQLYPANVSTNLNLWLRADSSSVTESSGDVSAWTSIDPYAFILDRTISSVGGTAPLWYSSRINGNPTVNFSNATGTERLAIQKFNEMPTGDFWITTVYSRTTTGDENFWSYGYLQSMVTIRASSFETYYGNIWLSYSATTVAPNDGIGHILTMRRTGSTLTHYFDGLLIDTDTTLNSPTSGQCFVLGEYANNAGSCSNLNAQLDYNGDLAEIIIYDAYPSVTDQKKLNSYLALKYGITIDQTSATDYFASDCTNATCTTGTIMWDASAAGSYKYDVAGIGQDDDSDMDQLQSKSQNTDGILRVADSNSQDSLDFFVWANNNGAATWTSTGAPSGYEILSRQWQAQETGEIGRIDYEFDVADAGFNVPELNKGTTYYFIMDSNGDSDLSDETPIAMKDDATGGDDTGSDDKWTIQLLDFTGDFLFTIAGPIDSPVGVDTIFTVANGSTDFSAEGDLSSVSSMKLAASTNNFIQWTNDVDATSEDYDTYITMGTGYVSVDSANLDASIDSSSRVSVDVTGCGRWTIYHSAFTATSLSDLKSKGDVESWSGTGASGTCSSYCSNVTCSGSVLSFDVTGFDGTGGEGSNIDGVNTQTSIDNVVPTFTTHTTESWTQTYVGSATTDARAASSLTYPTNESTNVTFTATATDTNSDDYYLAVCSAPGITAVNSGAPLCGAADVNLICKSGATGTGVAATCDKNTVGQSNETYNWYAYICDHNGASSCSAASSTSQGGINDEVGSGGTPTPSGSPYHVNHVPTFTAGTITDVTASSIAPGETITFNNSADADGDTTTTPDTITLYICSGETDQGGITSAFDYNLNTCTGGTLLCTRSGVNPTATDANCDDDPTGASGGDVHTNIVSVPTAHATDYTVKYYVEDSHDFGTAVESKDLTVIDVAPVLTSYNTDDTYSFSVGASDTVTRAVTFTDNNGDGDPTLIDVVFFEDTETDDTCSADEQICYRYDNEALPGAANCTVTDRSGAGSGKTATGTDNSLTVSCDYTVEFNASCGTTCDADGTATNNWEMSATVTDGLGDTNFTDSDSNSVVPASNGISIAEAIIDYATVALDDDSSSASTTMQNLGNQILDVLLSGTNMTLSGYSGSSCASDTDCMIAAQQKFDEDNTTDFTWASVGDALGSAAPGAGDEADGCLNRDMAVRAVAATGTEDEVISWVIHIPAVQQSGSYTGTNTFAASAKVDNICTGTLY